MAQALPVSMPPDAPPSACAPRAISAACRFRTRSFPGGVRRARSWRAIRSRPDQFNTGGGMSTATMQAIDPERLARLEHVADRQEIYDCLVRFCRGVDRFDRELMMSAFHPDAIDDHGPFVGTPEQLFDFSHGLH